MLAPLPRGIPPHDVFIPAEFRVNTHASGTDHVIRTPCLPSRHVRNELVLAREANFVDRPRVEKSLRELPHRDTLGAPVLTCGSQRGRSRRRRNPMARCGLGAAAGAREMSGTDMPVSGGEHTAHGVLTCSGLQRLFPSTHQRAMGQSGRIIVNVSRTWTYSRYPSRAMGSRSVTSTIPSTIASSAM